METSNMLITRPDLKFRLDKSAPLSKGYPAHGTNVIQS